MRYNKPRHQKENRPGAVSCIPVAAVKPTQALPMSKSSTSSRDKGTTSTGEKRSSTYTSSMPRLPEKTGGSAEGPWERKVAKYELAWKEGIARLPNKFCFVRRRDRSSAKLPLRFGVEYLICRSLSKFKNQLCRKGLLAYSFTWEELYFRARIEYWIVCYTDTYISCRGI